MMQFAESWQESSRTERIAFASVALASCASLFFSIAGFPAVGHDSDVHLNWLEQFSRLFYQGVWYPRWFNDSNGGFGSPTFYFYPPLPYWIASFFRTFLPFVPTPFYNLMMLVASLGSLVTVRMLLRQYSAKPVASWTAALAYAFIAYRFADVFIRDALGEHWAMMFLPLVFIRRKDKIQEIAVLAVAWSGLLLCNVPIAILAAVSIGIRTLAERNIRDVANQLMAFAVALLVSAIYVLPSAVLRKYLHTEHLYDIHFTTTGFSLLDLFQWRGWLRFLASITLVAGAVAVIVQRKQRSGWWWIALFCVAVQIPIYAPWWHPRIAPFVQFTWRWDAILLLAVAVLYVASRSTWKEYSMIAMSFVTLFCVFRISNEFVLKRQLAFDRYRDDAPEYHPVWIPDDISTVHSVAHVRIDESPAMLMGLTMPGDQIKLTALASARREFSVHLSGATPVRFHLFYWPYWKLFCDGQLVALAPDANGFATANLPSGDHMLVLQLTESNAEIYGRHASIVGVTVLLALLGMAAAGSLRRRLRS
jgi:hypothetical protein